mgnify:CR=1 FL=1
MPEIETPLAPPVPSPTAPSPATDWRAGLTGEHAGLAAEKSLEGFKGKDWAEVGPALAKAFVETKKLVGAKAPALKIPDATSTPEEVALYRKAIGVPDTPEGYGVKRPEAAATADWDAAAETALVGKLHGIGTPPNVVQAILDWYGQYLSDQQAGWRREAEAAGQELRRDWGANYAANLGIANRAIQQYGGDALVDLFADNGMGRHPLVVKTFSKIGLDLMEAGAIAPTGTAAVTPEEAAERVKELQAELLKVPQGSEQARAVIDRIIQHQRIAAGRSA